MKKKPVIRIYFSDYFGLAPDVVEKYGAFNISLINDLPLFIDPFLLFNSEKQEYRDLHEEIIRYVTFLREKAMSGRYQSSGFLKAWFTFSEVKQTWLGFSTVGNRGSGLGQKFAGSLSKNLHVLFSDFGSEADQKVVKSSHLEKLCLIEDGVGRDNISDFTTNLIKRHLLLYTQEFAKKHLKPGQRKVVAVPKVSFNYSTESWQTERFELPYWGGDYIVLTPRDLLTKDETWINRPDMLSEFSDIVASVPNDQLRAQLDSYLRSRLPPPPRKGKKEKKPTQKELHQAISETVRQFPQILDYYIRSKELDGDKASAVSEERVKEAEALFIHRLADLVERLNSDTDFYETPGDTLEDARKRVMFLKDEIENKDGYRVFHELDGKPLRREEVVQLLFRLTWFATDASVDRETNNGRGPVDFKISRGAADASLVEFKLAKNSKLEQNLANQVEVYKAANSTKKALKVIVAYSSGEMRRARTILEKLKLESDPNVILINADSTQRVSASNVK